MKFSSVSSGISSKISRWWFWIAMIVAAGAFLRFTGYNFSLPYIDTPDEATFLTGAFHARGLYFQPFIFPGYPPMMLWIYQIGQVIVEFFTHHSALEHPANTVAVVRFAAVITGLTCIVIVGMLGRRVGGKRAGLLAAAIWAVTPSVVYYSLIGMAESWLMLFAALALYWGFDSVIADHPYEAVLSVIAGLMGILGKYSFYPALGIGVVITICKIYFKRSPERNRWIRALIIEVISIAGCAFYLFFIYGATRLTQIDHPETTMFETQGLSRLLDLGLGVQFLELATSQNGFSLLGFVALLIIGTIVYFRGRSTAQRLGWMIIVGYGFFATWLSVTYVRVDINLAAFYQLPGLVALVILISASTLQLVNNLIGFLKQGRLESIASLGTALFLLVPLLQPSWQNMQDRLKPDTRAALGSWSTSALDPSSILIDGANHRTFNREWGGYDGPYRVYIESNILGHPLTDWINLHVDYAALSDESLKLLKNTVQGRKYLNRILLLKTFPSQSSSSPWRGPHTAVYRLWGIQRPLDEVFDNEIRLVGYDLSSLEIQPRGQIHITLYWQALDVPKSDYSVYIHLTPVDSRIPVAQVDGTPVSENRPANTWLDPDEILPSREFVLEVPVNLQPGNYRLLVGLYNYHTGTRLLVANSDFVELYNFTYGGQTTIF